MQFRKTDTARQRKKVREEMRKQSVKNNIALLFMEPAVSREFGSTTGNSNYCQLLVLSSPLQRSSAIRKCDISENGDGGGFVVKARRKRTYMAIFRM